MPESATLDRNECSIFKPVKSISLDEWKIKELWCKGVVNELAYISFALELNDSPSIDIVSFAMIWSVTELSEEQLDDGWKPKKLKPRSVMNAILVLDEKGFTSIDVSVKVNQLSLFD
jgi:hypothetical protein